jgi:hypothetical protein
MVMHVTLFCVGILVVSCSEVKVVEEHLRLEIDKKQWVKSIYFKKKCLMLHAEKMIVIIRKE